MTNTDEKLMGDSRGNRSARPIPVGQPTSGNQSAPSEQPEPTGRPAKLLLHACCGPCSMEPVRTLEERAIDTTIFYTNSNIHPADEYEHRLKTLREWASSDDPQAPVDVLEGIYDRDAWEDTVGRIGDAALEEVRDRAESCAPYSEAIAGGASSDAALTLAVDPAKREARCRACYRMRFEEAASYAAAHGYDALGSTLSVSPYQYTDVIRQELERAAEAHGVQAFFEDYRPYYEEATRRSRARGMYRQNFCGCRISDLEAQAERAQRKARRAAKKAAEAAAHADERAAAEQERDARRAERRAYNEKQARKRAVLKAMREQSRE